MTPIKIITDEFKKAGLECAEETAEIVIKTIFEKILPRLAIESENATVKTVCGVIALAGGALESGLLKIADKIDGQVEA